MDATIFRIIVGVGHSDVALDFYSKLLDANGQQVGGGRVYLSAVR